MQSSLNTIDSGCVMAQKYNIFGKPQASGVIKVNPKHMKVNEKKVAEFVQSLLVKMGAASRSYKFMKEGVTVDGVKVFTEADDFAEDVEVFV